MTSRPAVSAANALSVLGSYRDELKPVWVVTVLVAIRAIADNGVFPTFGAISVNDIVALTLVAYGGVLLLWRRRFLWTFLAVAAATAVWAAIGTPEFGLIGWLEWLRVLSALGVAAAIVNGKRPISWRSGALSVLAVAAIPAMVACLQLATGTGMLLQGDIRATGSLAHPNTAGLLFAVALFCALLRLLTTRTFLDLTLGAFVLVALVATQSFGSFAAVLAMTLVFVLVSPRFRLRTKLAVASLAVIAPVVVVLSPLGSRLQGLGEDPGDRGSAVDSISWRLETWAQLWTTSQQAPWFGRGLGASTSELIVERNLPHNEYLRALVELGWIGSIILCAALVFAVILLARNSRGGDGVAASAALALIAGFAVNAIVANTILYTVPLYAAALLLAACVRSIMTARAEGESSSP